MKTPKVYVLPLATADADLNLIGGKGMSLASLSAAGFPVPDGFHVNADAYRAYLEAHNLQEQLMHLAQPALVEKRVSFEGASRDIQSLFTEHDMPEDIQRAIVSAYRSVEGVDAVAVRSSANAEDLPDMSFAGQQDTYLNVQGEDAVIAAVRNCWASLWTERALSYRHDMGVDNDRVAMSVVVQKMVDADAAGVLFTVNAITGERSELLVNASFGLGESVVSGQVTPDSFTIDRESLGVRTSTIGAKEQIIVADVGGTIIKATDERERETASLSPAQLKVLAELALSIEAHLGGVPQDIEWAISLEKDSASSSGQQDFTLHLLQSRPITHLPSPPIHAVWEPRFPGEKLVRRGWVEHVLGPLSPLFETMYVQIALEDAYRKRELGGKVRPIPRHVTVNGWVYTRYGLNKVPDASNRLLKVLRGSWSAITMVLLYKFAWLKLWRYRGLPRYLAHIRRWKRLDARTATVEKLYLALRALAYADAEYWLYASSLQGLSKMANTSMTEFLSEHAADAGFVRGQSGTLGSQTTDLLAGYPSKSNDALVELARIATSIRADDALSTLVLTTPARRLMSTLESDAKDTARDIANYLDRYGQQTFTQDFVEPTLREAPVAMLSNLQFMVAGVGNIDPVASQAEAQQRRESLASKALDFFEDPVRSQFRKLYRSTSRDSRYREDAMFYMGAAWSVFRPLALELGQRLAAARTLDTADDVFYLTNDELLVAVEPLLVSQPPGPIALWGMRLLIRALLGAEAAANYTGQQDEAADLAIQGLKEKAGAQRDLRDARKRLHAPATIPGSLMKERMDAMTQHANEDETAEVITGFATSAGTISAQAAVLFAPEDFGRMIPGSILVCPFTTPAWTQLFAQASGLVTDIGGVGGHGSIVAREYGIPAVMGTGVGTQRIHHGQRITIDGDAGTVLLDEMHVDTETADEKYDDDE